jgi:septal ring factor EnvC (AmiA/AmiB activator)
MLIARKIRKLSFSLIIAGFLLCIATVERTLAQSLPIFSQVSSGRLSDDKPFGLEPSAATDKKTESSAGEKSNSTEERLNALEQALEAQNAKLDELQKTIAEQKQTIRLLAGKLNSSEPSPAT